MGFLKGAAANSIGGSARVLIAASSYPPSRRLSEIINLADTVNYVPQTGTYGWVDLGLTHAPTRLQHGFARTEWSNEQFGRYLLVPGDWSGQVTSEFLEVTQDNKIRLMLANAVAEPVAGEAVTEYSALDAIPTVRLAVLRRDRFGRFHGSMCPRAQWDGTAIQETFGRTDPDFIPMTWATYPDDTILQAATGMAVIRIDFDQHA